MRTRIRVTLTAGLAGALGLALQPSMPSAAQTSTFAVGVPTIVDPVRGVGEPMIAVDNANNAWITGPGGSSTQTSFFWHSRDGGLTYPMLGPSSGHWLCPSGGGDSHVLIDRVTGAVYLTDQEALASLGFGRTDAGGGSLATSCASAPAVSADRPFEGVLHPTGAVKAPQYTADGSKPIVYLSWLCAACAGNPMSPGGLAFGWSDDGVSWHPADPGVPGTDLITSTFFEAPVYTAFAGHGTTLVDQQNGYVYTALSCSAASGCPNGSGKNEIGIAVGAPGNNMSNIGQFATETYTTVAKDGANGVTISEEPILFPIITMDSAGTLYETWVSGSTTATSGTVPAESLHIYYAYSKDRANHYPTASWSKPVKVDSAPSQAAVMPWVAAGDAGKIGFVWLGSNLREYPSQQDANKVWHPFMATVTGADTATPAIQQAQVGTGPNHLSDVCLQGTVGCIQNVGNRNMADFISCDIGPDGALQATWANDANRLATFPTTLIPGLPLTETAREVSGPRLIGSGDVSDSRFSTVPTSGIGDQTGDALYPVQGGSNVRSLDLTGSRLEWDGSNLIVHISAVDLSSTASPSSSQTNVWYLTTWLVNGKLYFAKAQSSGGGPLTYTAGTPASYDRPGLNGQTVATLVDYRGGTTVQGRHDGTDIAITVPTSLVGNIGAGALLESVTAYTALDNGQQPFVAPGGGNMPTETDATPAYNAVLGVSTTTVAPVNGSTGLGGTPNTSAARTSLAAPAAAGIALLVLAPLAAARRRRRTRT